MSTTLPQFHKPTFDEARINLLVWGPSGCGKTTLAATAPGLKAFVQFDNQGTTSIANREDFALLDLSGASFRQTMMEFNKIDPFGMRAFLQANPQVETVVIDSITTLSFQALQYAVTIAGGKSNIEVPGMNGYGTRNNVMRRAVQVIMQICSEQKKHLIVITHEAAPDKDEQGNTVEITMSLSSSLANDVSLRFNEVWHMQDTGKERLIYVRPHGVYKPCKSRMFADSQDARFTWRYNADMLEGSGIVDWFTQWKETGGKKIPLPKK
jgi:hypothetical protein